MMIQVALRSNQHFPDPDIITLGTCETRCRNLRPVEQHLALTIETVMQQESRFSSDCKLLRSQSDITWLVRAAVRVNGMRGQVKEQPRASFQHVP
jgi:hypothetical protein